MAYLYFEITEPHAVQMQLTDLYGRIISTFSSPQPIGTWQIPISTLAKGMYNLQVISQQNTIKTLKLLKN